jgi:hypothetical protein
MSIAEEVIKALTAVVTPEMKALQERVDANHREVHLRFDALNARFDELLQRLALERRIDSIERELEGKKTA